MKFQPPCYTSDHGCIIICEGDTSTFNLTDIFTKLSHQLKDQPSKHFAQFRLNNNTAVTELPARVFSDILFEWVLIEGASSLKRIHRDAFAGPIAATMKRLYITDAPVGDATRDGLYDVFGAVRTLALFEVLWLKGTELTAIPAGAVQSFPHLFHLFFVDNPRLTSVGDKAFSNLPAFTELTLEGNPIVQVSDTAFNRGQIKGQALAGIKRIVHLDLNNNGLKFLDQAEFEAFLQTNPSNLILSKTECLNKGNDWLRLKYAKQWFDDTCSN
ncbi:unnamed protein product [Medioppia subpectinata]|uniref:Uncharacterized protein n=1 Tax=Medioppia subpectinata TaxID=1979941 RepID=A0A7R9KNL0_9ACAR|nr:unnamed protein product [Medioppia subpectinata]CAG2105888.1 unnamed protein product [Medioppia subpectinata]